MERNDVLFIRSHAHLAPTFVDVGANCGLISAHLFDKFARFYLFEPAISSFSVLKENCELNPKRECHLFNIAISDKPGEATFLDEGNYSGTSRLVDESKADKRALRRVPVDTLDNRLRGVDGNFVVKIDVEGAEERVFRGANGLFADQRIKLVMFERLGRTNLQNILTFLREHDYVVFRVIGEGLVTQDPDVIAEPLINLFACPHSAVQDIAGLV
jgi:FkbM family methyltransferase